MPALSPLPASGAPPAPRATATATASAPRPAAHEPRLARVAALVADASRSRMLAFLMSGEYATAGELAHAAGVTAATASGHLAQLVEGGLLVAQTRGRHRYFKLADDDVARALEALALVAERDSHEQTWRAPARARLREARCCHGHLAGRRGVGLLQAMLARHWMEPAHDGTQGCFLLTAGGAAALDDLGFDGSGWHARMHGQGGRSRRLAHACLDWSERRDHLAGPFAVALLAHFCQRGWLRREPGERALAVTPPGFIALAPLAETDGT